MLRRRIRRLAGLLRPEEVAPRMGDAWLKDPVAREMAQELFRYAARKG